jgi:hypothetical protein
MGGNIAFHRRQPVKQCPDETICNERYGVCIRKTNYRPEQEDRVSTLSHLLRWTAHKLDQKVESI